MNKTSIENTNKGRTKPYSKSKVTSIISLRVRLYNEKREYDKNDGIISKMIFQAIQELVSEGELIPSLDGFDTFFKYHCLAN